jgi:hypothetical protein
MWIDQVIGIVAGLSLTALWLRWPIVSRRTLYLAGGALYFVLQVDFWIAPWRSALARWSLIGSTVLTYAFATDMLYLTYIRYGPQLRSFIKQMRRD